MDASGTYPGVPLAHLSSLGTTLVVQSGILPPGLAEGTIADISNPNGGVSVVDGSKTHHIIAADHSQGRLFPLPVNSSATQPNVTVRADNQDFSCTEIVRAGSRGAVLTPGVVPGPGLGASTVTPTSAALPGEVPNGLANMQVAMMACESVVQTLAAGLRPGRATARGGTPATEQANRATATRPPRSTTAHKRAAEGTAVGQQRAPPCAPAGDGATTRTVPAADAAKKVKANNTNTPVTGDTRRWMATETAQRAMIAVAQAGVNADEVRHASAQLTSAGVEPEHVAVAVAALVEAGEVVPRAAPTMREDDLEESLGLDDGLVGTALDTGPVPGQASMAADASARPPVEVELDTGLVPGQQTAAAAAGPAAANEWDKDTGAGDLPPAPLGGGAQPSGAQSREQTSGLPAAAATAERGAGVLPVPDARRNSIPQQVMWPPLAPVAAGGTGAGAIPNAWRHGAEGDKGVGEAMKQFNASPAEAMAARRLFRAAAREWEERRGWPSGYDVAAARSTLWVLEGAVRAALSTRNALTRVQSALAEGKEAALMEQVASAAWRIQIKGKARAELAAQLAANRISFQTTDDGIRVFAPAPPRVHTGAKVMREDTGALRGTGSDAVHDCAGAVGGGGTRRHGRAGATSTTGIRERAGGYVVRSRRGVLDDAPTCGASGHSGPATAVDAPHRLADRRGRGGGIAGGAGVGAAAVERTVYGLPAVASSLRVDARAGARSGADAPRANRGGNLRLSG